MSELKFKAYGELEINEALSDASHVIIEENGDVKRFPANSIGKVKTVNGAEPDESGNVAVEIPAPVQPDFSQNDPTAPDYVKNRPFYTGNPVDIVLVEDSTVSFSEVGGGVYQGKFSSRFSPTIGETYKVSWDGTVYECVCVSMQGARVIGNASLTGAGSDSGEPFLVIVPGTGEIIIGSTETSDSHTISIRHVVPQVVQIDEKYLPDTVATKSEVETAQTTAENAQTAAENAQTAAENAQTAAENAQTAVSQGVVGVKTITDIGEISGMSGVEKKYKGLNIKVNSTVTVTSRDFGSVSMRWDGYRAIANFLSGSGPRIILEYKVGTDTYILRTTGSISLTVEKMEYTEVPVSTPGVFALPYLQFPHILLYSNSGKGKLFKITVDDSGNLTATEVTE